MGDASSWNKQVFGNVFHKKNTLLAIIKGFQNAQCTCPSPYLDCQEESFSKELDLVLLQEEAFWKQKSRDRWISLSENNTSYFYRLVTCRKSRSKVLSLIVANGS